MEIRERTIEEIKKLDSNSLSTLYEIVVAMQKSQNGDRKNTQSYLSVRKSLRRVKGSLSEEIAIGGKIGYEFSSGQIISC